MLSVELYFPYLEIEIIHIFQKVLSIEIEYNSDSENNMSAW